jgi:predicted nucleic acid-binding protein
VTFLDSNIPMYLIGAAHPLKANAQILLEQTVARNEPFVTDAEVLQEILRRYVAINRREAIPLAIQAVLHIVDEVLPVEKQDVLRAAQISQTTVALSARDAIHIAIMERHGVKRIMTFDAGFDRWPGLIRVHEI